MEIKKIILIVIIMLICGITDLLKGKIYNFVTFPGILMGFALNYHFNGWTGLISSAGAFGICFLIFIILYITGGFGAGDVKLIMALGSIVGLKLIFPILLYIVFTGGIMANVVMIKHKQFIKSWKHALRFFLFLIPRIHLKSEPLKKENSIVIPYGYAISLGTLIYFLIN